MKTTLSTFLSLFYLFKLSSEKKKHVFKQLLEYFWLSRAYEQKKKAIEGCRKWYNFLFLLASMYALEQMRTEKERKSNRSNVKKIKKKEEKKKKKEKLYIYDVL